MEFCFKSTNLHSDCKLVGVVGDPRKAASCIHRRFKNCKIMYDMSHVLSPPLQSVDHSTIHSQPMGQQAGFA